MSSNARTDERTVAADDVHHRKHRWVRWLLLVVALLAVLVFIAPYIVATGPVTRAIVASASGDLRGKVTVDDLSLGWLGPVRVSGLTVTDPDGRQVLRAETATVDRGVLGLAFNTMAFRQVQLDSAQVDLYVTEDGSISLAQAFEEKPEAAARRREKKPSEPEPPPDPRGDVLIRGARVRVIRPDRRELSAKDIDTTVRLRGLNDIGGEIALALSEGGKLKAAFQVDGLSDGKDVRPELATVTIKDVQTPEPVNLHPVAAMAMGRDDVTGWAELAASGAAAPDKRNGTFTLKVTRLRVAPPDAANVRLSAKRALSGGTVSPPQELAVVNALDATIAGTLTDDGKRVGGNLDLASGAGKVHADGAYTRPAGKEAAIDWGKVLSDALAGRPVRLPDLAANVDGQIDLAVLGRTVPGLLALRKDVEITAGRFAIDKVRLSGGESPVATGKLELTGLAIRRVGAAGSPELRTFEPVALPFDIIAPAEGGVQVRDVQVISDFASLQAKGPLTQLTGAFKADLSKLHAQLAEVFETGELQLAGIVTGTVEVKPGADASHQVVATASATGVTAGQKGRAINVASAAVTQNARLVLVEGRLERVELTKATANLDDAVALEVTGNYQAKSGALAAELKVSRADLAYLSKQLPGLGFKPPQAYTGTAAITAGVSRESETAPIRVPSFTATVTGLAAPGKAPMKTPLTITLTDLTFDPTAKGLAVASAKLESEFATAVAKAVNLRTGDKLAVDGTFNVTADLAGTLAFVSPLAGWEKPPSAAGKFGFDGRFGTSGDQVTVDGKGGIDNFEFTQGEGEKKETVRQKRVDLAAAAKIDQADETVHLTKATIDSEIINLRASGTIKQYRTEAILDLSGDYSGQWDKIMLIVHDLAPATAGAFTLDGPTGKKEFAVTGPARKPTVAPVYRGVNAGTAVAWSGGTAYGLKLGKAEIKPGLKDGKLSLPITAMALGTGTVQLGGTVDFAPAEPVLSVPGSLQVLQEVPISPELARELLGRINPLFAKVVRIEGTVSLATRDLQLPLGETIKTKGSGSARLDLSQLNIEPAGPLGELLKLVEMGGAGAKVVRATGVDVTIRDGRIHYQDFTLVFGELVDLKFSGSVGFDDTVALQVSVPVRPALLERFGVKSDLIKFASVLEGMRLPIPITGTRGLPKLDTAAVDIKPLMEKLAKEMLRQGLKLPALGEKGKELPGLLDGLLKDLKPKEPPQK